MFAEHFTKVLNNHKQTDDSVLDDITLREVMHELDNLPTWAEFIIAVTELTNDKAPGLKNVPPNAFKAMSDENLRYHFDFIIEFWENNSNLRSGTKAKSFLFPKAGIFPTPINGGE